MYSAWTACSNQEYTMVCKTIGNTTCLILTWVVIHRLFPVEKNEVRHFGNILHRVHLRIPNVCNCFFTSERTHKAWESHFLCNITTNILVLNLLCFSRIFRFCTSILLRTGPAKGKWNCSYLYHLIKYSFFRLTLFINFHHLFNSEIKANYWSLYS